jgi:hypothetical protein
VDTMALELAARIASGDRKGIITTQASSTSVCATFPGDRLERLTVA